MSNEAHIPEKQHVLSSTAFEKEWQKVHESIFRFAEAGCGEPWIPDQVFQKGFRFSFIHPYFYFREHEYGLLRQAMRLLGEKTFVIGAANSSVEKQNSILAYSTEASYAEYTQGKSEPMFFTGVQPLELYLHGKRDDWGIVASESYNLAIIGYRSKKASLAFKGRFIDQPERLYQEYLTTTPQEYRRRLEVNYLEKAELK